MTQTRIVVTMQDKSPSFVTVISKPMIKVRMSQAIPVGTAVPHRHTTNEITTDTDYTMLFDNVYLS